jgi:hypothetical protein
LFEFVKLLGEFPVLAGRLPEGRICQHRDNSEAIS